MTYKLLLKDLDNDTEPGIWKLAVFNSENIEDKPYEECLDVIWDLTMHYDIKHRRLKIVDNSKDIDSLNFPA